MNGLYRKEVGCKDSLRTPCETNNVTAGSSYEAQQITTKTLSYLAAALLVLASAGFGCVYAWTTGSQHGSALGVLSVAMALGLELAKPMAIAGSLAALRELALLRAPLLLMLGVVAVAYSLTAELSLMATTRGDVIAERKASSSNAATINIERERLGYELGAIGTTRPSATIEAEITGKLASDGRLQGCEAKWLTSTKAREVCIEVNQLRAEKATAERKEKLEADLAALRSNNEATVEKKADPGAHALATYLGALGLTVNAEALSEWLVLVPVLALELGSALAGLLVGTVRSRVFSSVQSNAKAESDQAVSPENTSVHDIASLACPVERLKLVLLQSGGEVFAGQRALARAVGVSVGAMNTMLDELARAGQIAVVASTKGTKVKLIEAAA